MAIFQRLCLPTLNVGLKSKWGFAGMGICDIIRGLFLTENSMAINDGDKSAHGVGDGAGTDGDGGGAERRELFKTADFLRLIGESRAAEKLDPANYFLVCTMAYETFNEKARGIFDILVEEEKRMAKIKKTFDELVKKAVDDFSAGVTELEVAEQRAKIKSSQSADLARDEETAAEILKQI